MSCIKKTLWKAIYYIYSISVWPDPGLIQWSSKSKSSASSSNLTAITAGVSISSFTIFVQVLNSGSKSKFKLHFSENFELYLSYEYSSFVDLTAKSGTGFLLAKTQFDLEYKRFKAAFFFRFAQSLLSTGKIDYSNIKIIHHLR